MEKREQAQNHLIAFTKATLPGYEDAYHHQEIAEHLEAVERGEIDRLLINEPPRHGKSELASRRFPAWCLGRHPEWDFIAASYNSDLASDFGREVRNIVNSPEYQAIFETTLAPDSKAANRWATNKKGHYIAAGVCTATTGRGANVFLIDDPLKDREEAESELRRQRVYDWYTSTAYTRLAPGGSIILIQTRWHEDDLAGRLLDKVGGDKFVELIHPALKDGKALWPSRYPVEALERIRSNIGERDWASLYQQKPAPEEGDYFKREWFGWFDLGPNGEITNVVDKNGNSLTVGAANKYGASDYAITKNGGDWTVHLVADVDESDNIFLTDHWRAQTTSDEWIEVFINMALAHRPMQWGEESGQILKSLGPFIEKRMNERKCYVHREQYPSLADKPARARAIQARASMGKVFLPRNAPWLSVFLSELLMFDNGTHDDQVDALSIIGRMLDNMVGGQPQPQKKQKQDRWDRLFDSDEDELNWKTC